MRAFGQRLVALCIGLICWFGTSALSAAETSATDAVSFDKQIRLIFQANCQGCHQPAKAGGQYVMTAFAGLVKGGESGSAAVVPGKPEASSLISQITPKDGKAEMPKGK